MKGWIGTALALAIIAVAITVNQTHLLGQLPLIENPVIMTVLAGTICLIIVLALQSPEYSVSRQVALWTLSAAVVTLALTNLDQLTEQRKLMKEKQVLAKQAAEKAAAVKLKKKRKHRAAQSLLPDTPELEKRVEKVYDRSKLDPLAARSGKETRLTNQLTTPDEPLDENWEPPEAQKKLFRKFLKSQGLRYDPDTAYKFPPDSDDNLFK